MSFSETPNQPRKAVGIDLGTTFSAIAHIDAYGKPQIIPNAESERITPSVILFDGQNAIVGSMAKQNAVAEPEKIVDFVKREMGKSKTQFHREFAGKNYSAEELSALIIKKLKNDAEKYLGESVTDAVITVPAYFNDAERTATLHAGQLAGLNVLQVINEPTAAALAYGLDKLENNQTVFVFDLGGGTFDVTIMRIESHHIRMIASNGDHRLGGKDWDDVIVNWIAEEFDKAHGENPLLDLQSYQDLYNRALTAKIQLSSRQRTTVVHSYNGKSVKVEITREQFEERCRHLLEKCKTICEIVIQEAGLNWNQIDRILLTGGMTRMPSVRDMIGKMSNVPIADDVSPDEAVSIGAAVQGILSLLGEEDAAGARVLPVEVREQFSSADGALIRVTNITTHTLGVVLWDDAKIEEYVFPMIRKMTPVPVEMKNSFGTAKANMKNAIVRVVEGESSVPGECTPLGICDIELPPFLPKGSPVELTYTYNENQVLEGRGRSVWPAKQGLDRSEYWPLGKRNRNGHGRSLADQGGLTTVASQFEAWRYRILYPITRLAGTAGRTTTRRTITSALCLDFDSNASVEQIEDNCRRLLIWWQKKLPLKNQPSNPAAQLLRGGLDEAPLRLAEARTELLNPESRARLDAELRTEIVAAAVVEFKKILSFVLSDKKLTEEGERRLFDAGREAGLGDDEIKTAIDGEVERLGAARVASISPPTPVTREAAITPSNGTTNGTSETSDPFAEFRRILRMSRLALDGEEMTDDQRDAMCNVGESLGLAGGEAEDLIDEYLDEMNGLPPTPVAASGARAAVIGRTGEVQGC
jgi:molecular chaperone DnaK